jgi:hypothetical protein
MAPRSSRLARALLPLAVTAATLIAAVACSSSSPSATGTGSGGPGGSTPGTTAAPSGYPLDGTLKLNQIQALGTHNSFHVRAPKQFRDGLEKIVPGITKYWDYEQPALGQQFDEGARQIELDVWLDPDGRYATRHALPIVGLPAEGPAELKQPGLKVLHIAELDYDTNCLTFVICLQAVKAWSAANPGHVPIAILVEAKDDKIPDPLNLNFSQAVPFDKAGLDTIDSEIRSVFDDKSMITPDMVRGTHKTLEEAVLAGDWPTLGQSRGKVMFLLDNGGLRDEYAEGHPSLQGRVMFTDSEPGTPEGAFVKKNDAIEKTPGEIAALVKKGYIVRTRSDADAREARENDLSTSKAALTSGATWISTDFPVPDPAVNPTYQVRLPGGTPARCNEVNAPKDCKSTDIENPQYLKTK